MAPFVCFTSVCSSPRLFSKSAIPSEEFTIISLPLFLIFSCASYVVHPEAATVLAAFRAEALQKWDFNAITQEVLASQRRRRFVWGALKTGIYFKVIFPIELLKMS